MKEPFVIFWILGYLLFFMLLPLVPHVVGFISYLLLKKENDFVAHFLGVTIPPLSFFFLFKRFYYEGFDAVSEQVAGLLLFALIQLIFSLLIHLAIHNHHKLKEEKVS